MEHPFIALVCGGRDYAERDSVFAALDKLRSRNPNITILHGACPTGADSLAQEWAVLNERPYIGVPAQWGVHGASAGPIRNQLMLCYLPNGCVAFPGGAGTRNCVEVAERADLKVWFPAGR